MPKRSSKPPGRHLATVSDTQTGEIREVEVRSNPPRDPIQAAHSVLARLTGAEPRRLPPEGKDPLAVELGRRGGLKGGKKRMAALSEQERSELGKHAAKKRWQKIKLKVKIKE